MDDDCIRVIVSTRPETADDEPFVLRLMLERTAGELPLDHVPKETRDRIIEMQVRQRLSAARSSRGSAAEIILADSLPVGWMCVNESLDDVRLIEIMVLEEYRSQGIGATVIRKLAAEASAARKPLRLRVNVTNERAIRLYERLGFRRIGGDEVQHEMEIAVSR